MSEKDLYPMFPVPQHFASAVNADGSHTPLIGMTLRDYFAAQALPVFLANDETEWAEDVRDAYAVADKMLAERNK